MPATSVVVGIDVAKAHVDVSVPGASLDARRFDNEAEAHSALAAALKPLGAALVLMEATGGYTINHLGLRDGQWQKIAVSYFEAGHMMYIHQPSLVRMAAELRAFVAAG